jgi:hypothetical protein
MYFRREGCPAPTNEFQILSQAFVASHRLLRHRWAKQVDHHHHQPHHQRRWWGADGPCRRICRQSVSSTLGFWNALPAELMIHLCSTCFRTGHKVWPTSPSQNGGPLVFVGFCKCYMKADCIATATIPSVMVCAVGRTLDQALQHNHNQYDKHARSARIML